MYFHSFLNKNKVLTTCENIRFDFNVDDDRVSVQYVHHLVILGGGDGAVQSVIWLFGLNSDRVIFKSHGSLRVGKFFPPT